MATVTAAQRGPAVVVTVTGDLDPASLAALHTDLVRLIAASAYRLVVDLTGTAGEPTGTARVLADVAQRVGRRRGWLRVAGGALTEAPAGTTLHDSVTSALG
ncbi:STAS domain-containing protein [Vallicoccus soli]|uniref:STAS domain-containing protein n=1 Tax=Vallicoccus soli TaxID=2339232 RepID=A0A3A3Z427_9ACTN|nr:hypothetical protein [Vallicoccus soli]RJK96376.1 hypothetical protein D5H78_09075 [Vallicoccus soli]